MLRIRTFGVPLLLASSWFWCLVQADGIGTLGLGKWLYRPTCAHSCRRFIINSDLVCDGEHDYGAAGSHSHGASTDAECYLTNVPFLHTMALCIDEYCSARGVALSNIQSYWEGHLATGTLSDRTQKPAVTYSQALSDAQQEQANQSLDFLQSGEELNKTALVREEDFTAMFNYQWAFERGETDHGWNSVTITTTVIGIPILTSLLGLVPVNRVSRLNAMLSQPLLGRAYRAPVAGLGTMPTRAQSIFLVYIVAINIILMCVPLYIRQPNARQPGAARQALTTIGDRAGVLAAANLVPLLLTSTRNNILLWLTRWNHTTFLLLHRWLGYVVIMQTVVHSAVLLHVFVFYSKTHASESQLPYWYWGIISTLAICFILPFSMLPLRTKFYEIFLVTHQILAALALIAYFLHIWYLFEYNWGYEIWVYVAGAVWFLDRLIRILRVVRNGRRIAMVRAVSHESDLLRIEIDGLVSEGHVYVFFPSLTWRVWENHPFSVLSSFQTNPTEENAGSDSSNSSEKGSATARAATVAPKTSSQGGRPCTTLLLRPQKGLTLTLLEKTRAAGGQVSVPVWVESSYHAEPAAILDGCSTLVCIVGGVGITAAVPVLRRFAGPRRKLYWCAKHEDVVQASSTELCTLDEGVSREIVVGERLPIASIVETEVSDQTWSGDIGIFVCGPAGMADDVRAAVGQIGRRSTRRIVFVDEAFAW